MNICLRSRYIWYRSIYYNLAYQGISFLIMIKHAFIMFIYKHLCPEDLLFLWNIPRKLNHYCKCWYLSFLCRRATSSHGMDLFY